MIDRLLAVPVRLVDRLVARQLAAESRRTTRWQVIRPVAALLLALTALAVYRWVPRDNGPLAAVVIGGSALVAGWFIASGALAALARNRAYQRGFIDGFSGRPALWLDDRPIGLVVRMPPPDDGPPDDG